MADLDNSGSPNTPAGPWPSEAEIEMERRLLNIENSQNRTNQLVMQLQLEYRQGINEVKDRINHLSVNVSAGMGEVAGLLKKFLANGH